MRGKLLWCLCAAAAAAAILADSTDLRMDAPAAAGAGGAAREVRRLQPFSRVQIKVPFNVLVAPSPHFQLTLEAEPDVRAAVVAAVSNGSLSLGTAAPFSSTRPIRVTVGLPADQLRVLNLAGSSFTVIVLPGFAVTSLAVSNAGTSRLAVQNVTATSVHITSAGLVIPENLCIGLPRPRRASCAPQRACLVCAKGSAALGEPRGSRMVGAPSRWR